jgi:hypothetical protein
MLSLFTRNATTSDNTVSFILATGDWRRRDCRSNGQREDGSAAFLGVRAIGRHVITRVVVSSVVFQAGQPHSNDFSIGPLTYRRAPGHSR